MYGDGGGGRIKYANYSDKIGKSTPLDHDVILHVISNILFFFYKLSSCVHNVSIAIALP